MKDSDLHLLEDIGQLGSVTTVPVATRETCHHRKSLN